MASEAASAVPDHAITAERDHVRKLSADYAVETSALERYALTLAGIIWSWCLTNAHTAGVKALLFAPVLTTSLFGIRAFALYRTRQVATSYLEQLQRQSGLAASFGWEQHLMRNGQRLRVITAFAFWSALQLITLVVALVAWWMLP